MRKAIISLLAFLTCVTALAQEAAWRDTLKAAVKTDTRRTEASLGRLQTGLEGIRGVVSPLGEGDPTRWAQSLPGVATGADGTTSMYVRGGGTGNNLFTMDGVPVYGYSHILGLTTIVPSGAIESAELGKGGFDGAESNFTAAHLRLISKTPEPTQRLSFSVNNFLAGLEAEGPIGNKLSYIVSARISPLTYEYKAVHSFLPDLLSGFDNFAADVGDVYGKICLQTGVRSGIDLSVLGSLDRYRFETPGVSRQSMGWHNLLGQLRFYRNGDKTKIEVRASANDYGNSQLEDKVYRFIWNQMSLTSRLREYTIAGSMRHQLSQHFALSEGLDARYAIFAPGQVGKDTPATELVLAGAWLQADYSIKDKLSVKAAVRGHYYDNMKAEDKRYDPEASLLTKINITKWLTLEISGDRLVQYYHTLEGLPVGWSLDMIVPSGATVAPETALQANAAHGLRRRVLQGDGQTGLLQVRAIPVQRSDGRLGESRGHRQGNRLWCGIPLRVHRRRLLRQNGVHPLEGDASRLRGDERGPSLPRSFRPSPRAERNGVMARLQRGIHPPERPLGERRSRNISHAHPGRHLGGGLLRRSEQLSHADGNPSRPWLAERVQDRQTGPHGQPRRMQCHQPFQPVHALLRPCDGVLEGDRPTACTAELQLEDNVM